MDDKRRKEQQKQKPQPPKDDKIDFLSISKNGEHTIIILHTKARRFLFWLLASIISAAISLLIQKMF